MGEGGEGKRKGRSRARGGERRGGEGRRTRKRGGGVVLIFVCTDVA